MIDFSRQLNKNYTNYNEPFSFIIQTFLKSFSAWQVYGFNSYMDPERQRLSIKTNFKFPYVNRLLSKVKRLSNPSLF
jgi:hypothetical protein